jgi:hypothetical protein
MPSETFTQLLDRAATLCGIDPGYWDIWGRYHTIPPEAKQAILKSLGFDASGPEALERSLAERTRREWQRVLPPVVVASESAERQILLSLPVESLGERARFTVRREDGHTVEFDVSLWDLPDAGSLEMGGRTWISRWAITTFPCSWVPRGRPRVTSLHRTAPGRIHTWAAAAGRRVSR